MSVTYEIYSNADVEYSKVLSILERYLGEITLIEHKDYRETGATGNAPESLRYDEVFQFYNEKVVLWAVSYKDGNEPEYFEKKYRLSVGIDDDYAVKDSYELALDIFSAALDISKVLDDDFLLNRQDDIVFIRSDGEYILNSLNSIGQDSMNDFYNLKGLFSKNQILYSEQEISL